MSFPDDVKSLQGLANKQYTEADFKGPNLVAVNDFFRRVAEQANSIIQVIREIPGEITSAAAGAKAPFTLSTVVANEAPGLSRTRFSFPGTVVALFLNRQLVYPVLEYTPNGAVVDFVTAPGGTDTVYAIVRS